MPEKWPYVNFFPYRVSPRRLGTSDYDAYVRMLVNTVGQPFLSYDNYSLVNGQMPGRFLIGEFADDSNRPYFLIVNKDLRNSFQFQIQLRQEGRRLIRVSPYSGQVEPFDGDMDWLAPGAGILFRVE